MNKSKMKPTLAIVLVVVLGNVFVVGALKCYACVGSKTSDCYNGKTSSMVVQQCPQVTPSLHSFVTGSFYTSPYQELCLTVVETNTNPDMFVRGCGILPGNVDPCNFMKHNFPISSCKYCRSDLCNISEQEEEEIIEVIDVNIL